MLNMMLLKFSIRLGGYTDETALDSGSPTTFRAGTCLYNGIKFHSNAISLLVTNLRTAYSYRISACDSDIEQNQGYF